MPKYRDTADRNAQRRRYYHKHNYGRRGRAPRWTQREIEMVLAHMEPDRVTAQKLKRSLNAVQRLRWQLRKAGDV